MNLRSNDRYNKIENHVNNNMLKYSLLLIIFLVGIIVGGMCFSSLKSDEESLLNIKQLIEQIIAGFNNEKWTIINDYFFKDIFKIILLIIISSSMIGLPLLLIWILYDGISLSFTINFFIYTYGMLKGNLLAMLLLFIPNLAMLLANMIITISSIKLIKNIVKMKKSLKMEIMRHLIICALGAIIIMIGFLCRIFAMNFVENIVKF